MQTSGRYINLLGLTMALAVVSCSDDDSEPASANNNTGNNSNNNVGNSSNNNAGSSNNNAGNNSNNNTEPDACADFAPDILANTLDNQTATQLTSIPQDDFASGFSILEGPVWIDGALLVSQINANGEAPPPARMMRYVSGQELVVVNPNSGSNGMELDPQGRLAAARHSDGTVSYVDLSGGAPTPIVTEYDNARFNSPNDLTFHSNGTLYFTDPDWQSPDPNPQSQERAYLVSPGQSPQVIEPALTAPTLVEKPNGIVVSGDESRLYIGGTNGLFRFSLSADGTVLSSDAQRLDVTSDGVDGMTVDCAGNLYVTTGNRILVLTASEQVIATVTMPLNPTNVELGGADGHTLFITTLQTTVNGETTKPALFSLDLSPP